MSRLTVRVQTNAKISEVVGRMNGALKIKLHAPPIEGRANEELVRLLSEEYGVPKSCIRIIKGQTSKTKVVEINT